MIIEQQHPEIMNYGIRIFTVPNLNSQIRNKNISFSKLIRFESVFRTKYAVECNKTWSVFKCADGIFYTF